MTGRMTRAALAVLLAFGAVVATGSVAAAWVPGPPPKAIELTATPEVTTYGQAVKLALSLTPKGGGQPQGGTVTFRAGETVLGTAEATKRITTLTTTALPAGEPAVTATYSGDPRTGAATSNTVTVVVDAATTTTTLSSAGVVAPGERAELKAVVRAGGQRPTGSVAFSRDDTLLGVVALNTNGVATWRPLLAEGSHEIIARYLGSATYGESTSATVTQVVAPAESTIDQDNDRSSAGQVWVGASPVAQTFTAGRTGLLDRVQIGFLNAGATYQVTIRPATSGLPDEDVLGGTSGTTTNVGLTDIVLDEPVPVVAGTTYAIAVSSPTTVEIDLTGDDSYAAGAIATVVGDGWWTFEAEITGIDFVFTTWVR